MQDPPIARAHREERKPSYNPAALHFLGKKIGDERSRSNRYFACDDNPPGAEQAIWAIKKRNLPNCFFK